MCDMQNMPAREEAPCDEDAEMNFATFSAVGSAGTHFVTTGGQLPVTKIQQNVSNNGATISQVVGMVGGVNMGDGMQYVRALDGGATLQTTPQLITIPITLPGAKPGDPQSTVQIQVLSPNITLQQQQPKYQMQIPIQGFQQGGAVLTVAYSPENNDGIQLLGNTLPEGLQLLTAVPQEMPLTQQQDSREQVQPAIQHQVFITPNQQIVINGPDSTKILNNNTSTNNQNPSITDFMNSHDPNLTNIIVKEECDDNDDESSQGTEAGDSIPWQLGNSQQDLVKYLNTLPPQQTQQLPASLQQFLRLNSTDDKKINLMEIETEIPKLAATAGTLESEDDKTSQNKKKKKYKKKPRKSARPKPGQIVITQSPDGGVLFCCPECEMAFPEKEELELHLSVHKIERRFICGLCGAGLKRKEHLERHKLGHNPERPYVCGACGKGFKRREHLNLHTVIHSGVKTELCLECGKGFYRKDHLRKHTRSHESKRARDEANADPSPPAVANNTILPEITIHVPASAGVQVPVQITVPQHVVTSLAAAQQQRRPQPTPIDTQLDALLAQHAHNS